MFTMKKYILFLLVFSLTWVYGQDDKHKAAFELGSGLQFSFNDEAYSFRLGGMIQPYFAFEGKQDVPADYFFNAKRSYFNFSGKAQKEKIDFFLQMDFSRSVPLLDAWVSYQPIKQLNIAFGQKQGIANNREMLVMEDQLQFPDRSLLSTSYSLTGREFGLFLTGRLGTESSFSLAPQIAITSGDGANSFGADSRDVDLGGLKYAARLDIHPLGFFKEGNDRSLADMQRETQPKVALGFAASYNDGASHATGEGHGNLFLYNFQGGVQLPDYRQLYADILVKYQGFSLLGEYTIATATSLLGSQVDEFGNDPLLPTEISEYLSLGRGFNAQAGYVSQGGYAVDVRYSSVMPEFGGNQSSIIQERNAATLGLSRYIKGNGLKLQLALTSMSMPNDDNMILGEFLIQLGF